MMRHLNEVPLPPARVVVVGARGFIARALRQEIEARAMATAAIGSADIDLTSTGASDALAAQLRPADAVVMLAALTPDKGRDVATLMTNLTMMRTVCAALQKAGAAHLLYFSSDAVYGQVVTRVTEQTPPSPTDLYGAMHLTRELMAANLPGIPLAILRVTGVYGAGDPHNSYGPNRFRRMAEADGQITLFGAGAETRDHVQVGDVARLAVECLLRRSVGTLNVATGRSIAFRDLAAMVASQHADVHVRDTPTVNPVTHRHYDPTARIKAFPDFQFTNLESGIRAMCRGAGGRNDG